MSIRLFNSAGGYIDLKSGGNGSTANVFTLPAETGTILTSASTGGVSQSMIATGVAGTGPAFSAYKSSGGQTISTASATKVTFDVESFDTNNNFASSRFTPTVAGYYQINANVTLGGSDTGIATIIYKNGNEECRGWSVPISGVFNAVATACKVIYLDGSTDYVEVYAYQASGVDKTVNAGISQTAFSGALIRAA